MRYFRPWRSTTDEAKKPNALAMLVAVQALPDAVAHCNLPGWAVAENEQVKEQ
jgi:hypothetical protein